MLAATFDIDDDNNDDDDDNNVLVLFCFALGLLSWQDTDFVLCERSYRTGRIVNMGDILDAAMANICCAYYDDMSNFSVNSYTVRSTKAYGAMLLLWNSFETR